MEQHGGLKNRFKEFVDIIEKRSYIQPELYDKYKVKRGLRNKNGTGVLVGITRVADVKGYKYVDGEKTPCEGDLSYRGYSLIDIVKNGEETGRNIFEEVSYLLLLGSLPNQENLKIYKDTLCRLRPLPDKYLEDVILKIPSKDLMNKMMQSVLALYTFDESPDDTDTYNVLKQSINLIAKIPSIMAYCYAAKRHYIDDQSLIIHRPKEEYNTAENILHLIRENREFTQEEVDMLDILMVVHAEHGGGNNSAFATHVVSSSGTDTYSAIATALGSLKGPRHGGANLMVASMVDDIKAHLPRWDDRKALRQYLEKILEGRAFDQKGLIYGLGHAVYTMSDPRAVLLKEKAAELAKLKGFEESFALINDIEEIGGELLRKRRNTDYPAPANVDLYSGLVYQMLDIPHDLYTPLFGVSRTTGWCAHRMEQVMDNKIMRPAYVTLNAPMPFIPPEER
ncbi:MAG: citrate synthase [Tissierellia bacterium]|nr:citrate synthase [Tissierellia bacterium]